MDTYSTEATQAISEMNKEQDRSKILLDLRNSKPKFEHLKSLFIYLLSIAAILIAHSFYDFSSELLAILIGILLVTLFIQFIVIQHTRKINTRIDLIEKLIAHDNQQTET